RVPLTRREDSMTTSRAIPADAHVLHECLDPLILEAARAPVRAIRWERFALATSYEAHVATVQFVSGDTQRVFAKNFGSTVRPKDSPKQRREREVRVYRELL